MFRTIVVPLDHTDRAQAAVPHAAALARQSGARLRLVTIRPSYTDVATVNDHLTEVATRHGVDAELVVDGPSDVAAALIEMTADPDVLLCLATHARRPVTEMVLGSISEQVVRASHRPVLMVGPQCAPPPERYESIVVALDGSALAECILPTVVDWSTHLDLTPWLFQVLSPHVLDDVEDDIVESSYLQRLAADLVDQGAKAEWDTVHDRSAASGIVRFADEQAPGLVAVTTHGLSGLGRMALAGVALRVALHAQTPVLVFRPGP
jgi:nucleotide-binding universal stress UspA family protein